MKFRTLIAASLALACLSWPAHADQNSTVTPVVGPLSMSAYAADVNSALVSIATNFSGPTPPATFSGSAATYQFWMDTSTSPAVLRMNDGAQWDALAQLNTSTHLWSIAALSTVGNWTVNGALNVTSTTSGTSTTAAALTGKSLGLTENLFVGGALTITGSATNVVSAISSVSNTSLGTYYNGPSFFYQGTNTTNNNTLALDFRGAHGNSYAAIIAQVTDQTSGAVKGKLVISTANGMFAASGSGLFIEPTGGVSIGADVDPGAGNLNIAGTTASTSTTTGALTVAGGLGVVGATFLGGNANMTTGGNTQLTIASTFSGSTQTGFIINTVGDTSVALVQFQKSSVARGTFQYNHNATGSLESFSVNVAGSTSLQVFGSTQVSIPGTIASSSTTTGTLVVGGGIAAVGAAYFGGVIAFGGSAIASLPTCNTANKGVLSYVTNGVTSPTYLGSVSTTGSTVAPVFCNGTAWIYAANDNDYSSSGFATNDNHRAFAEAA